MLLCTPVSNWYPAPEEEEEANLFAKKAGCQKGLQPINAGYRKHKHYMLKQLNQCQVSRH